MAEVAERVQRRQGCPQAQVLPLGVRRQGDELPEVRLRDDLIGAGDQLWVEPGVAHQSVGRRAGSREQRREWRHVPRAYKQDG